MPLAWSIVAREVSASLSCSFSRLQRAELTDAPDQGLGQADGRLLRRPLICTARPASARGAANADPCGAGTGTTRLITPTTDPSSTTGSCRGLQYRAT